MQSYSKVITGNKWLIAIPVMLAALTAVLDASIVNVAIPNMQSSFGAGVDEIDWVLTGYLISNVIIIPTTGWLSSVVGLKRYFAISQFVFMVASLLCGLSWNLPSLIFFRVLQGIGGGAILPVSLTILLEAFPPSEFAMASALYGVGATIGPAIGPTLGGWLTDTLSWPWIFFVNVPLVTLSIILSQTLIGENREALAQRASRPIDIWGLLTVGTWLATLQIVLQEGEKNGWFESPFITGMSVLSCAALIAFLIIELRVEHPLINIRIFTNRNFTLGSVAGAMLGAALFGMLFITPLFAGNLLHYTALQIGLLLFPAALVSLVLFPVVGQLSAYIDGRFLMFFGLGLFAAALYFQSLVDLQTSWSTLMWIQILRGASLPFLFTSIGALSLTALAPKDRADGSSLFNLTRTLGGSFGIAILATLVVNRQKFHFERFGEALTQFSSQTSERLASITAGFMAHGSSAALAAQQAKAVLSLLLTQQAFVGAFADASLALAVSLIATAVILPFFKMPKLRGSQAPAPAAAE